MSDVKRTEILFLYDVRMANPNGDPARDNRPRIVNGKCFVTFDRIKRTIRDYWHYYAGENILLKIEKKGVTREELVEDYTKAGNNVKENILNSCLDVRTFGALLTLRRDKNKKSKEEDQQDVGVISLIGPIQFGFGETIHDVEELRIEGTTQIQGRDDKESGTFTTRYVIRYGLFSVYGLVDYVRAKAQEIPLTDEDVDKVLKGLWYGTMSLASTSKLGHYPRLLLTATSYGTICGPDLQFAISAKPVREPIESFEDLELDFTKLVQMLKDKEVTIINGDSNWENLISSLKEAGIKVERKTL